MRPAASRARAAWLVFGAALLAAGCGDAEGSADSAMRRVRDTLARREPPVIAPLPAPYVERDSLGPTGRLTGQVRVAGTPTADTTVRPLLDTAVCGETLVDTTLRVRDGAVGDALVWLADVGAGKPLPLRRRYEAVAEDCRLTPRVQGVVAGGTVNVRSTDPVLYRINVVDAWRGDTVQRLLHNDFGQVVPVHAPFTRAGLTRLEGVVHPWLRATVAAFDHPYFTRTDAEGRWSLDSIPPGRYELRVWQERLGLRVDTVAVVADSGVAREVVYPAPSPKP